MTTFTASTAPQAFIQKGWTLLPRAFPGFPLADLPDVPAGFADTSYRNDTCPSAMNLAETLQVYIDYADPSRREIEGQTRFCVLEHGDDITEVFASEDWEATLAFLLANDDSIKPEG
jgi:hypothetical protein